MDEFVKTRQQNAKLKPSPNAAQQVESFNAANATPEIIPELNDPQRIDWTDISAKPAYLVGQQVRFFRCNLLRIDMRIV
jgi:hypothetical protein